MRHLDADRHPSGEPAGVHQHRIDERAQRRDLVGDYALEQDRPLAIERAHLMRFAAPINPDIHIELFVHFHLLIFGPVRPTASIDPVLALTRRKPARRNFPLDLYDG
jgi:hypothetical protein